MSAVFERDYASIAQSIMTRGKYAPGRNGYTRSIFGATLTLTGAGEYLPILSGRKIYWESVLGEFAAFIRGPKKVEDFEEFNCNYWKQWAEPDGSLNLDYGNSWFNFNGVDQIHNLLKGLRDNPHGRRHIVSGWRPDRLNELSLPCCHMLYQWYVGKGGKLEMMWYQRSADWMIGVPSDMILAAVFNKCVAIETGLDAGCITMVFGDTHIYEEHEEGVSKYLEQVKNLPYMKGPKFNIFTNNPLEGVELFTPDHFDMHPYDPQPPIKFELKS